MAQAEHLPLNLISIERDAAQLELRRAEAALQRADARVQAARQALRNTELREQQ